MTFDQATLDQARHAIILHLRNPSNIVTFCELCVIFDRYSAPDNRMDARHVTDLTMAALRSLNADGFIEARTLRFYEITSEGRHKFGFDKGGDL